MNTYLSTYLSARVIANGDFRFIPTRCFYSYENSDDCKTRCSTVERYISQCFLLFI